MYKKKLKIGIFSSKFINYKFETYLKEEGYENIYTFTYYSPKIEEMDILFIEENFLKKYHENLIKYNIIIAVLISIAERSVFLNYIKKGAKSILLKSAGKDDFILSLETLISFKSLENKIEIYANKLKQALQYKDKQENLALNKQLKIIKDNVSMKYFDNNSTIVSSYFQPKDILSGDSYFATHIEDKHFFCIADAMGKGLSASLTAMLSISFISYLFKTINYNFETYINMAVEYIKTILLNHEILCIVFVELDNNKIKYCNFYMPPIYLNKNGEIIKLKPNNLPLLNSSDVEKIKIDTYEGEFNTLAILSDGLLEKNIGDTLLINKFLQLIKKHFFLNDLMNEIKKEVDEFDDDITVLFITKDNFDYELIFDKEYYFDKNDIDDILKEIEQLNLDKFDTISIILIEVLLNTFKYQVKINKDLLVKDEKDIDDKKAYVKIKIFLSDKYIKFEIKENKCYKFNISEILQQEKLKKHFGRGIVIANFFASAIAYNKNGDIIRIYIRRYKNEIQN